MNGTLPTAMCRGYCGVVDKVVTTHSPPLHIAQLFVSRSYVHLDKAAILFPRPDLTAAIVSYGLAGVYQRLIAQSNFFGPTGLKDNLHKSNRRAIIGNILQSKRQKPINLGDNLTDMHVFRGMLGRPASPPSQISRANTNFRGKAAPPIRFRNTPLSVPYFQVVGHIPELVFKTKAGPVSLFHGSQLTWGDHFGHPVGH